MRFLNLFIPYNFNYMLLEQKNSKCIYIYNYFFYINIKILNTDIYINNNTNIIQYRNIYFNKKINLLVCELYNFIFSLEHSFYKKIKFTGKGFKIKKKKNNIIYYFNTAHINLLIVRNILIRRLSKNKYIFIKSNKLNLIKISNTVKNIRCNNIFTKRGLRISRQLIVKKKGKN